MDAQTQEDSPSSVRSSAPRDPAREQETAREQVHLDRVLARVDELRVQAARHERAALGSPLGGTPQAVYERDVTVAAAATRRAELDVAGEGLVFGRLDRVPDGVVDDGAAGTSDGTEVLHVGRLGIRTAAQEPLVIDWRAPAAAAYYQATAAQPLGVVRRRTITTSGPAVRGIEDELLDPDGADRLDGTVVVGDGAFMAAVSRERGTHMRDIVATIQAEQDQAVRAPDRGALVVTGGPGTGKTAVALHRVAYLLYARREYYARRDVLVVGPSSVFVDYISQVLPALGETSVRLTSIGGLPDLPAGLRVTAHDEPAVAVVKGSVRMVDLLRRVVEELSRPPAGVPPLRIVRRGVEVRIRPGEMLRRRERIARGTRQYNDGRATLVDGLLDDVWRAWTRRPGATRIEADDRSSFIEDLREDPAFVRTVDSLWPVLDPGEVFAGLRAGTVDWAGGARGLFSSAEVAALTQAWASGAGAAAVSAADAALLDELRAVLGPVPEPPSDPEVDEYDELVRSGAVTAVFDWEEPTVKVEVEDVSYAHVVVDEAQDVTPMQWRMLARRAGGATWTIVGDWAQSAWPDVQEVRTAMAACLGRAPVREVTLSTNYRTSTEIAALAAGVLHRIDPTAVPPAAVRSTGVAPALVAGAGPRLPEAVHDAVADLLREVSGTVGVICPYASVPSVRAAVADLLAAEQRLTVLDTWAVKGLEFDGCAVVAPEAVVAESLTRTAGLRSLYVALTRATQRLTVVSAGPLDLLDA